MEGTNDQAMENNDGEDICAICLEDVTDWKKGGEEEKTRMYYFACDQKKTDNNLYHVFHQKCIHEWFQRSGKKSCPLCRSHCKDETVYVDEDRDIEGDADNDTDNEDDDEWYFRNRYRNTFEIFGMRFYWWSISASIFCTVLVLKYTLIMLFILEMLLVKALLLSSTSVNYYNNSRVVYHAFHPEYPIHSVKNGTLFPLYPLDYPDYS